jgi:hypothetical protein
VRIVTEELTLSSLERAKSFMQRRARLIALTAVPLATLVAIAPVKAGTIALPLQLDPGSADTCLVTAGGAGSLNGGSACTVGQSAPGIKMFGNGTAGLSGSGGGILGVNFTLSSGTTNSGFISGQVPISWDFIISDSTSHNLNWTVTLGATVTGVGAETVFTDTFTNVTPGTIIGSMMSNSLPAVQVTAYSLLFSVTDPSGLAVKPLRSPSLMARPSMSTKPQAYRSLGLLRCWASLWPRSVRWYGGAGDPLLSATS